MYVLFLRSSNEGKLRMDMMCVSLSFDISADKIVNTHPHTADVPSSADVGRIGFRFLPTPGR